MYTRTATVVTDKAGDRIYVAARTFKSLNRQSFMICTIFLLAANANSLPRTSIRWPTCRQAAANIVLPCPTSSTLKLLSHPESDLWETTYHQHIRLWERQLQVSVPCHPDPNDCDGTRPESCANDRYMTKLSYQFNTALHCFNLFLNNLQPDEATINNVMSLDCLTSTTELGPRRSYLLDKLPGLDLQSPFADCTVVLYS